MLYKTSKGNQKGTIILMHGNSSSRKIYSQFIDDKSIAQSKVALSFTGHDLTDTKGLSEGDSLFEIYSNETIRFINSIDDDILLVGNSIGGHLAIEIASEIKRLKGIVIMGAPPLTNPLNFEEAFIPNEASNTFLQENPTDEDISNSATIAVYDKKNVPETVKYFKQTYPKVRKMLADDLANSRWKNQRDIFVNLDLPKFIIHGIQDPAVKFEYLQEVKDECKNDCSIYTINECGHYPSFEQPEEFSRIMNLITNSVF